MNFNLPTDAQSMYLSTVKVPTVMMAISRSTKNQYSFMSNNQRRIYAIELLVRSLHYLIWLSSKVHIYTKLSPPIFLSTWFYRKQAHPN